MTREFVIHQGLQRLDQSRLDQQWLNTWIVRHRVNKTSSLSDYRQQLIRHAHLLRRYRLALDQVDHHVLAQLKFELEQSHAYIYDVRLIEHIQKLIHRRQSKRKRIRRRRRRQIQQHPIQTTHVDNDKSTCQKTLKEKIHEVEDILHTIEQYQHVLVSTNKTNEELLDLRTLCLNRLDEYRTRDSSNRIDLCNYLFNNHDQSFYESTETNAHYYLRAHHTRYNLVRIRQAWDQYLTDRMSSTNNVIPLQWHEPVYPCDCHWSQYIFNK
jgi:hypothetical protein